MVTNASRVTSAILQDLEPVLDQVAVSIDSFDESTSMLLGRGDGHHIDHALEILRVAHGLGIKTKLNTVVTASNVEEFVADRVLSASVNRWKVFQVLPIKGENNGAADLWTTETQFSAYLSRNAPADPVPKSNDAMTESCGILDPLGRPFQNAGGQYQRGLPIHEVGLLAARVAFPSRTRSSRPAVAIMTFGSIQGDTPLTGVIREVPNGISTMRWIVYAQDLR